MGRKLAFAAVAVMVLAALAAGAGWLWLRGSGRPVRQGEQRLPGLEAQVRVRFDRWGVPHVEASSERDLAAALGYLHANDRLTQLELGRRAAQSRLAEILGPAALELDVYFLRLGARRALDALESSLGERARAWYRGYADGVNAWLAARGSDLPPELRLLGVEPEPWTVRDSLSFVVLMARDLAFWNGRPEEARFRWLRAFGAARLVELLGDPELHLPPAIVELARNQSAPAGSARRPRDAEPGAQLAAPGAAPGSNNWAVGPGRTASGGALIANDPHLGYALPGVWYQALLRCPTYDAAGMTLPGLPAVVLGRGPYAAWAFTSTMLDEQDLFFEELDDAGERYRRGDAWLPLEVERVAIAVRGRKPQALVLRSTDRGPLFEADPEQGLPPRSLTWASHFGGDLMSAFFVLAGARTPGEVEEGIAGYVAPAQNLVMAFADGTLYQTVIGRLPARRSGDGRLPSPGWDPAYGWDGFLPRTANPRRLFEPPTDAVLVSANNDVRPPGYAQRLPADFFPPFRADRIRERLLERRDWDFEATAELESDVTSRYARQLVAALAGAELSGDAARARDALVAWDGELARRGAAALFALVERQLQGAAFSDEARHFAVPFPGGPDPLLRLLQGRLDPAWLDDVATPDVEGRDEILERALAAAWRQGVKRWGEDVEEWDYGSLHALTLRHRLDAVPVLGRLLRRGPFPLPGSGNTVAAFGSRWQGGSLPVIYGPSMRWIVDWGLPEAARAGLPGGQSGHLADSHYDDQIEDFLAGRLHPAPWSEQAIARATVSELILLP